MRVLPPCRLHIYRLLLLARRHTAYSHRRWAIPPHRRDGPLPQAPSPTFRRATALVAVPPVSCAEVRWLGYVHACRHCPSSLFEGPGDAPVPPLSCSRGQRDTPVPPCVSQYSHHTVPGPASGPYTPLNRSRGQGLCRGVAAWGCVGVQRGAAQGRSCVVLRRGAAARGCAGA